MIYLSSKDEFLKESLTNLICQINPLLITNIKDSSFVHIEAHQANDQLYFTYNQKKEIIKTPINKEIDVKISIILEFFKPEYLKMLISFLLKRLIKNN